MFKVIKYVYSYVQSYYCQYHRSGVFINNFEHVKPERCYLVSLLLAWNIFNTLF